MDIILMSIVAGIIGTGLGGVITAIFGSRTDKMVSAFLSFAGGVMTSIVLFELIPDASQHSSPVVVLIGLTLGVVMVLALNIVIDKSSSTNKGNSKLHETFEDFYHESGVVSNKNRMKQSGMLMFLVIGLHNIPEGLIIGAAGHHDAPLGMTLAIMIGIHNTPEGMAIAAPLISGELNKGKAIVLTLLAGVPTVFGAAIGYLVGGVSDLAIALSFAIAGGAMLYAVFGEILPQSMHMSEDRVPTIILLVGIAFGYIMTYI